MRAHGRRDRRRTLFRSAINRLEKLPVEAGVCTNLSRYVYLSSITFLVSVVSPKANLQK